MSATVTRATWAEISRAIRQRTPQRGTVMSCGQFDGKDGTRRVLATVDAAEPYVGYHVFFPLPATSDGLQRGLRLIGETIQFVPVAGDKTARIVLGRMVE